MKVSQVFSFSFSMIGIFCMLLVSIAASQTLSMADINSLKTQHNMVRKKARQGIYPARWGEMLPGASYSDLPNLKWDESLALLAQGWANKCGKASHDNNRKSKFKKIYDEQV